MTSHPLVQRCGEQDVGTAGIFALSHRCGLSKGRPCDESGNAHDRPSGLLMVADRH